MNAHSDWQRFFQANQQMWDEWAAVHMRGNEMYPVKQFVAGQVGWEPNLPDDIGSVKGKSILHLQCHFGMDTLMWARQGARVTGIDFSETAIRGARALNDRLGLDAQFLQANIYDLPNLLQSRYDIVLTYYGVLPWLPDLDRWATLVASALKSDGFLYLADVHPFMHTIEGGSLEPPDAFLAYSYFSDGAQACDSSGGTYAEPNAQTVHNVSYRWKHRMGTIVNAIVGAGMRIEYLHEFPYTFCDLFDFPPGGIEGRMAQDADGWWRLTRVQGDFIPLMFSLKACQG